MDNKKIKKHDEQTTNRVLAVFVCGALGLWLLSYLFKAYDIPTSMHTAITVTYILLAVFSLAFIGSIIWFLSAKKKGTFSSAKVFNGRFTACLSAVAMLCFTVLLINFDLGIKFVYLFVSAIVVLYLIYAVYQRTFFFIALTHGIIAFLLYVDYKMSSSAAKYILLGISVLICVIAFIAVAHSKNGTIKLLGKSSVIYSSSSGQALCCAALIYGLTALLCIACLFIPVIYAIYAIAAFLVCCAIYFTFRLI